jgi:integrase
MKRSQIKRKPLADSVLKTLEPEAKTYRELDTSGLYFEVKASGTKSWVLRYKTVEDKWAWKGLGGYPAVSGKSARKKAQDLQSLASDGEDLRLYAHKGGVVHRQEPVVHHTLFRTVGEDWYRRKVVAGRAKDSLSQYRSYLGKEIYPVIGDKPLDQVTRQDCAAIQHNIELRGAYVIAGKVSRWINQIFSLAVGQGLTENNPASNLKEIAQEGHKEKHYPYLLETELPAFLKALSKSTSKRVTLHMVWLILRTACRPGMARFAEWSEFDLDTGLWTVPAHKMKTDIEHLVPLSSQSVQDLKVLQKITGLGQYLFPGNGWVNPVASENTVNKALRLIGYKDKLVGHGARHTASTLLNDHDFEAHIVEAQLAHKLKGVAGVYNKAVYLDQRRAMMQWYSDYLDKLS